MPYPLIGITGRARAGKSTAASLVLSAGLADYEYFFAQPFKNMLKAIGLDSEDPFWVTNKETPIPLFANKSYRQLMQTLGTEWGRRCIDENIWVSLAEQVIHTMPDQTAIISDVRYDNEAALIKKLKGILIHISSPYAEKIAAHTSEDGVDRAFIDVEVINDGTLSQLQSTLVDILNGVETRKQVYTKDK